MTVQILSPGEDLQGLDLTGLCDHLEDTHHAYIRGQGPVILEQLKRLSKQDQQWAPLMELFCGLYSDLLMHLQKEEQVLFPYCRQLLETQEPVEMHCGTVAHPIRVMVYEHDSAEQMLGLMRKLTQDYVQTENQALMQALQAFDADLCQHMYKENEILFPRALERERFVNAAE
ncbi:hypothetical protein COW36_12725 [bacterium (Candidatus Blackallbacteria) CG17_big_fil_post_rev_8_21_14_2_50_48_46]|uniref:Hemerythrin-like domain-containing protein n=1 Tax=bacterium (Candidatus Blackallbacteria) CG17_big_fil_post_rev_8_21_14_2_50_48_46 TaxID=2014261 RepID=A0A2M7G435_9BACT|nr:MAG: hypothetical protein COW64_02535 [bacterium (Candidatus Blackallbacteria) CG18_big_fil_WC_8_21_14_2_50_49_26]PIW16625.1 MAG: hypothetical protein COW36_12725 [bacterium (Candidatus Blackallbacteria) CG17_big_fil_post_rev_8_21_14_2_50_48_46]PIW46133.1 MAG: hypothetical protein COW20_17990 [bacterium (Candidatus Blackallbacteria) CG13_big_fil_rev_8_21_14_2_50_49_14]